MKKLLYLTLLSLLINNCSQPIFAGPKTENRSEQEIQSQVAKLEKGKQFKSQDRSYTLLPDVLSSQEDLVYGVDKASEVSASTQNAKHTVLNDQILQTKGNFVIFNRNNAKVNSNFATFPVVLNEDTKQLGILTGTLIIKYENSADADLIKSKFGLNESKRYPHLSRVVFKTTASDETINTAEKIKAQFPQVEITIEILENFRSPN